MLERLSKRAYFMQLALTAQLRADCKGRQVGAVIVKDGHIVSTGYNGTPIGFVNCTAGGCFRCAHPEVYRPGQSYDLCICVHAEQNAILSAARFGPTILGAQLYTTTKPCFGCLKEAVQAGITAVYYVEGWEMTPEEANEELVQQYEGLAGHFQEFCQLSGRKDDGETKQL